MSSKFLDKTGLDTLWAKIKSTFQTLGNLVTAWGSTPSDTKYPSEKLVKTSLDAISTNARTIPQDISKGTNVVVNSNGTLQTNYNWTATTFIGDTDLPEGVAGCFHRVGGDFFCNEFISLNTGKEFTVESWYRVKTANTSTVRLTLACFDIDKKSIQATDICYGIGTLTTVAREIKNGDTEIYLTDLSASAWDTATYYERRLIFWDYQNSLGYTYPPETYSKHTYYKSNSNNGTWLRSSLDRENNKITLIVPWDGGTVPVGTKVSRGGSGSTYYYAATSPASGAATVWTKLSGKLKGFSNNVAGGGPFRPGTAFVKIGWVNANTASPEWFEFCGIELRENPSAFNGVLPVSNGGTGATSDIGAEYNILNHVADIDTTINGDRKIALCNQTKSASNGVFRWLKLSNVWTWIKGLLSSESDVNISGNAATATTATTAAGYTSGGAIDTALQGKQDALGISSSGDAGKFLNEKGSWQVPVYSRSDGHSVWYRNSSWNIGQLLNQYVGKSTTWDNTDNYDLATLKAGDTIKIYVTVTNMANAHFVMDLKVTAVSSVAPTATVMAIYQADQNEVLDGTDADANNFVIPGNYILQRVKQVSNNWPGTTSGSLDYSNLCVTRLVRNDSSSTYNDTNNIQQSVRWGARQLYRTKINGTWGSWRAVPMCNGNYYTATGSATKPVYVNAADSVTECNIEFVVNDSSIGNRIVFY